MDVFFAVLFFAFSSTITLGPNNIMIMSSGVNYGIKASWPHLLGICLGFPTMVLLVGIGFGVVFQQYPWLHWLIKILGVIYLIWLAWRIASSAPGSVDAVKRPPLTFWQAAFFQWVNGKAWVMASGAIAAFTSLAGTFYVDVLQIAAAFLLMSFPCVGIWLVFGTMLRPLLAKPLPQRMFNISMGLLLVASVLPVINELWHAW